MAVFLGVHKVPNDKTAAEIAEGFEKYKAAAKAKGLEPISAVYNMEKGFAYCQTKANSADEVLQAHHDAEVPIEEVIEVKTLS